MKIALPAPPEFDLFRTIYSHGWCVLPPFGVEDRGRWIRRTEKLSSGTIVTATASDPSREALSIEINHIAGTKTLTPSEKKELRALFGTCLRMDEDFSEFYREARRYPEFRWIPRIGAGRMLRSPHVFEDLVKMMCTTNCSWSLTQIMVNNLASKLGERNGDGHYTFPTPDAIADCSEKFIRKEIRAGYRSPYLIELSRRVRNGELNPDAWRDTRLSAGELFAELRSVKGIGPYAAGNIMKLLGRYDYLAIDSWCRKRFCKARGTKKVTDRAIEKYYDHFGKWRGLFIWLDMTKEWYDKKFPI